MLVNVIGRDGDKEPSSGNTVDKDDVCLTAGCVKAGKLLITRKLE